MWILDKLTLLQETERRDFQIILMHFFLTNLFSVFMDLSILTFYIMESYSMWSFVSGLFHLV